MKIYVSDNIYEYLAIGKRDIHSGVDVDFVVKSLEQHDAEVRKHVIAELEEWVKKYQISVGDYVYITALNLNAKLCKMKAELEAKPQEIGEKDE